MESRLINDEQGKPRIDAKDGATVKVEGVKMPSSSTLIIEATGQKSTVIADESQLADGSFMLAVTNGGMVDTSGTKLGKGAVSITCANGGDSAEFQKALARLQDPAYLRAREEALAKYKAKKDKKMEVEKNPSLKR